MGDDIEIISNRAPLKIEIQVLNGEFKEYEDEILQFGREEGSTIR
jgi:hypothetical protein